MAGQNSGDTFPKGLGIALNSKLSSLPINAKLLAAKWLSLTDEEKKTYDKMHDIKNKTLEQAEKVGPDFQKFIEVSGFSAPVLEAVAENEKFFWNDGKEVDWKNQGVFVCPYINKSKDGIGNLLPGTAVRYKGNGVHCERALNASIMQECIKKEGLDSLGVAEKGILFIDVPEEKKIGLIGKSPEKKKLFTGKWCVFANDVKQSPARSNPTDQHIKDLIKLVEKIGYTDFQQNNWVLNTQGKYVCIDTENKLFGSQNTRGLLFSEKTPDGKENFIGTLDDLGRRLTENQKRMIKNYPKTSSSILLPSRAVTQSWQLMENQYDSEGININKAKEQLNRATRK